MSSVKNVTKGCDSARARAWDGTCKVPAGVQCKGTCMGQKWTREVQRVELGKLKISEQEHSLSLGLWHAHAAVLDSGSIQT
eukprot:1159603-Pelagomonas_calceolata.AAC.8